MIIKNYISGRAIITKVFRDLDVQRSDWVHDAFEWMGEALEAIGSYSQTVHKTSLVKTKSHSIPTPPGLVSIQSVWYGNNNEDKTRKELTKDDFPHLLDYGSADKHPAFIPEKGDHSSARSHDEESWIMNDNYIKTSFESDWILIHYQAIKTDDDGFPFVPDVYEFKEAISWYIIHKMIGTGYKHPAGINYFQARKMWLDYCGKAKSKAKMPSYPEALKFRDSWVSLLPVVKDHKLDSKKDDAIDASNVVSDSFQRYTVEE